MFTVTETNALGFLARYPEAPETKPILGTLSGTAKRVGEALISGKEPEEDIALVVKNIQKWAKDKK